MRAYYKETLLPYWESDAALGAKEYRGMSGVDIDGTLTRSSGEPSAKEIAERTEAETLLSQGGRPLIHVTARTFELGVSSVQLAASRPYGVMRPDPLLEIDRSGQHIYKPIERVLKFNTCLNAHAHAGLGTLIFLRHKSSFYVPDVEYAQSFGDWRSDALAFLHQIDLIDADSRLIEALADIEDEQNYFNSRVDVWPPEYRVQLEWTLERCGKHAAEEKNRTKRRIRFWQHLFRPAKIWESGAKRIDIVDESNAETGRYVLYLVPHGSTKEHQTNRLIRKISEAANLVPSQLSYFATGDHMPDVRVGLESGAGALMTFLLVGGSRVYPHLSPHGKRAGEPYAGEKIRHFTRVLKEGQTERKGIYRFMMPGDKVPRTFIIGDEAFVGEIGPACIVAAHEFIKKAPYNPVVYSAPHLLK